jgi:glutathione S-transferase
MLTLFHHPLCPHSRFARLALGEYGLPTRQVGERTWERREEFLILNPAGTTPVLLTEVQLSVPGALIIAEYLDETYGENLGVRRLLPQEKVLRLEVRRVMYWFSEKFFEEVSGPLTRERLKQYMPLDIGCGSPDYSIIRESRENIPYHLAYIDLLLRDSDWLVGDTLTYADLAAAAHLSTADYLGAIPWNEDGAAKVWYERVQSRPAFQALLAKGWGDFIRR